MNCFFFDLFKVRGRKYSASRQVKKSMWESHFSSLFLTGRKYVKLGKFCFLFMSSQIVYSQSTDIKSVVLGKNSSHKMLELDPKRYSFPLVISFNFLVSKPSSQRSRESENEDLASTTEDDVTEDGDEKADEVIEIEASDAWSKYQGC